MVEGIGEIIRLLRFTYKNANKFSKRDGALLNDEYVKWLRAGASIGDTDAMKEVAEMDFSRYINELRCEDAERLSRSSSVAIADARNRISNCFDDVVEGKAIKSKDPNSMYISAAQFEGAGKRDRAKRVYQSILNRFPGHAVALKAADSLTAMKRAEDAEAAQGHKSTTSQTQQAKRCYQASRVSAYCGNGYSIGGGACMEFYEVCD